METIQDINVKALHDATGNFVRAAQAGKRFRISLNGKVAGILLPPDTAIDPSWDEIMAEVRAARKEPGPTRPNPILAERQQRNYAARLR